MRYELTVACIVAAIAGLAPSAARAQDSFSIEETEEKKPIVVYTNEVDIGIGYNTEDSFKFNEYSGYGGDGPFGIGSFSLGMRSPFDSDENYFLDGSGTDLGLDSRSLHLEGGKQGQITAFIEYDQTPHLIGEDALTPFIGAGSSNLTLPSNWVSGPLTGGMSNLSSSLTTFDVETERKKFGGGLKWIPFENWEVKASAHRELKDGIDTIGAAFGTTGGNVRSAILPEPINYTTDTFDASVGFSGERVQAELAYELSMFNNEQQTVQYQNAFNNIAASAYPNGVGETQLPPDNMAHHISLSGGYLVDDTTRITGSFVYGRMQQDENFLPYSANSSLTVNTPLPRNSLEGLIETYHATFDVATRVLDEVDLNGRYTFDLRDNSTPQDVFVRIRGDSENQTAGTANAQARINLPYDYQQHKVDLKAGYRIPRDIIPPTKVTLGYTYDQREREFEVVSVTREHTISAKVQSTPFQSVSTWIEGGHGIREGSTYAGNRSFLNSHTPEYLGTLVPSEQYENDPLLRKFWVADRNRDFVNGSLAIMPLSEVTIGFSGGYNDEDYPDSPVGLDQREMFNGTVDVSYSPMDLPVSFHAFTSYERMWYNQRGCSFNNSLAQKDICFNTPGDTTRDWDVETRDRVLTVGAGFDASVIPDVLDFGADYAFSRGVTTIEPSGGSALLPVTELPDIVSHLHTLNLYFDYHASQQCSLRLGYTLEAFGSSDFAIDAVQPNTMSQVLALGQSSSNYLAHVFGVSFRYKF